MALLNWGKTATVGTCNQETSELWKYGVMEFNYFEFVDSMLSGPDISRGVCDCVFFSLFLPMPFFCLSDVFLFLCLLLFTWRDCRRKVAPSIEVATAPIMPITTVTLLHPMVVIFPKLPVVRQMPICSLASNWYALGPEGSWAHPLSMQTSN